MHLIFVEVLQMEKNSHFVELEVLACGCSLAIDLFIKENYLHERAKSSPDIPKNYFGSSQFPDEIWSPMVFGALLLLLAPLDPLLFRRPWLKACLKQLILGSLQLY